MVFKQRQILKLLQYTNTSDIHRELDAPVEVPDWSTWCGTSPGHTTPCHRPLWPLACADRSVGHWRQLPRLTYTSLYVTSHPDRSPWNTGIGKERNVLFNDALNTFYLRLYGVRHMVKDHSDSKRRNPLPPHGLLFLISSKGSFICTIPQTG